MCNAIGKSVKFIDEIGLRRERTEQAKLQTKIMEENLRTERWENADKALDIIRKTKELDHEHPGWREDFEDTLRLLLIKDLEGLDRVISEGKIVGAKMTDRKEAA